MANLATYTGRVQKQDLLQAIINTIINDGTWEQLAVDPGTTKNDGFVFRSRVMEGTEQVNEVIFSLRNNNIETAEAGNALNVRMATGYTPHVSGGNGAWVNAREGLWYPFSTTSLLHGSMVNYLIKVSPKRVLMVIDRMPDQPQASLMFIGEPTILGARSPHGDVMVASTNCTILPTQNNAINLRNMVGTNQHSLFTIFPNLTAYPNPNGMGGYFTYPPYFGDTVNGYRYLLDEVLLFGTGVMGDLLFGDVLTVEGANYKVFKQLASSTSSFQSHGTFAVRLDD